MQIPFDLEFANAIQQYFKSYTRAQIVDGANAIFTGFLRKTATFTKEQRAQPISVELITAGTLFDFCFPEPLSYERQKLSILIRVVVSVAESKIGANFRTDTSAISKDVQIPIFTVTDEDTVQEVLENLLNCYGYTYNFSASGQLVVVPLFNQPAKGANLPIFDGKNSLTQIQFAVKEESGTMAEISWQSVKLVHDGLLFEDTQGAKDDYKCYIELQADEYFADDDDEDEKKAAQSYNQGEEDHSFYAEYDSTEGEVITCLGLTNIDVVRDREISVSCENVGTKARMIVHNTAGDVRKITKFDLYGTAYVKTADNITNCGDTSGKTYSIDAKFIQAKIHAETLAQNVKNWLSYADYTGEVTSKLDLEAGTFVRVIDRDLGEITARIIQKKQNLLTKLNKYKVEAILEYTPATEVSTDSTRNSNNRSLIGSVFLNQQELNAKLGYSLDISPDYQTIPCDSAGNPFQPDEHTTFIVSLWHGTDEITEGITRSVSLNGNALPNTYWQDDKTFSLPNSLLGLDKNTIIFSYIYNLRTIECQVTVSKLRQADMYFYTFVVNTSAVKGLGNKQIVAPKTVFPTRQMITKDGINFTNYGRMTIQVNNGEERNLEYARKVESVEEFDGEAVYCRKARPFLLRLGENSDAVLAVNADTCAVFFC